MWLDMLILSLAGEHDFDDFAWIARAANDNKPAHDPLDYEDFDPAEITPYDDAHTIMDVCDFMSRD